MIPAFAIPLIVKPNNVKKLNFCKLTNVIGHFTSLSFEKTIDAVQRFEPNNCVFLIEVECSIFVEAELLLILFALLSESSDVANSFFELSFKKTLLYQGYFVLLKISCLTKIFIRISWK